MHVLDLQALFGRRYLLGRDPAYFATYGRRSQVRDPWYDLIVCRHGEIAPWSSNRLAASTHTNGAVATQLHHAACCHLEQDGDDGVTVTFHLDDFAQVAAMMKPRRVRQTTVRQLESLLRGRRKYGQNTVVKSPKSRHQRTRRVPADRQVV